jgi:hypothetical protein
MKSSESTGTISMALSQFQKEVDNPSNTASNPFFKSKYAPLPEVLNTIRPILGKHDLAVIQNPYTEGDSLFITTRLIHKSGEWIETDPLQMKMEKNTPQGAGSAITYGRRYSLSAVLGISSEEDNDGNEHEVKKAKAAEVAVTEVEKQITAIKTLVSDLAKGGVSKEVIGTTIKGVFVDAKGKASANYNAIKDEKTAKTVLDALEKLKKKE